MTIYENVYMNSGMLLKVWCALGERLTCRGGNSVWDDALPGRKAESLVINARSYLVAVFAG